MARTDAQATRRDEALALLTPLLALQPDIFDPTKRAPAINGRAAETATTRQQLYRLLRRWWQRGMTPAALCPDYAASGAPGRPKPDRGIKRGTPARHGGPGMNVDDTVRAAFRDSVNRHLSRNSRIDITDAYHNCLRDHFTDQVYDETSARPKLTLRAAQPSLA